MPLESYCSGQPFEFDINCAPENGTVATPAGPFPSARSFSRILIGGGAVHFRVA